MTETKMQLEDWLDDLCVRFIINQPDSELSSVERICFAIEEAQWFYEDFIRPLDPTLPSLTLRNFCMRIFAHCPMLAPFSQGDHMRAFDEFMKYKTRIPVRGAILMNEEMNAALLVKGWKKGANWSFPRGKINWAEDDLACAIREVYEETGYDLEASGLVPKNRQVKHIEVTMHDQQMRLYVFRDVPMDTHFEPRTRKEISKIQWWPLSDLPAYRKKGQQQQDVPAISPNKFYMVAPFLPHLRKWITEQKKRNSKQVTSNQYLSAGANYDEVLTEEDQGLESNTHGPAYPTPPRQHIDTLEGTNEALRALLKIQPPTQISESGGIGEPVAENKGGALLALLQGNPIISNQQPSSNDLPRTPLEHIISQPPQPTTPSHRRPWSPNASTFQSPPSFPIQAPEQFSYQAIHSRGKEYPGGLHSFPQHQLQHNNQIQRPYGNPHSYQNQNLLHPQPLPPNVQKALFTGGPVHSPVLPRPVQESAQTQRNPHNAYGPSNPQYLSLHAPMVPPTQPQPHGKLDSHALALLNAFKSRDQADGAPADDDLPLRRYMEEPAHPPLRPQELPAEALKTTHAGNTSQYGSSPNIFPSETFSTSAPNPKSISEKQRSALLGLFKSPTSQAANPVQTAPATASPLINKFPAAELSAVDTLSPNVIQPSPAAVGQANGGSQSVEEPVVPEMNPELNLPFRAMKILARPSQVSDSESLHRASSMPKSPASANRLATKGNAHLPTPPGKLFQPQIMIRTHSNSPSAAGYSPVPNLSSFQTMPALPSSSHQSAKSATSNSIAALQSLLSKEPFPASPSTAQLDRQPPQAADQKQKLLSLFGAPSTAQAMPAFPEQFKPSPLFSIDPTQNLPVRSRVDSLSGDAASRRSSQTAMSQADKGFLLSYLDSVTEGSQRR